MVNRANNAPSALLMFGKPETFSTSTSVLLVRHGWPAPLTYSLAMLADPALGSTNMFRIKKWDFRILKAVPI